MKRSLAGAAALCLGSVACSGDGGDDRRGHQVGAAGATADASPPLDAGSDDGANAGDGSGDASQGGWPDDPPPAVVPETPRTDDCDLGGRTEDIVALSDEGADAIGAVAVTAGWVYFGTSRLTGCTFKGCGYEQVVERVPRCGGPAEEVARGDLVAAAGGAVYWNAGGRLVRRDEASGVETTFGEPGCLGSPVANGRGVYAHDVCAGALVQAPISGAALVPGPAVPAPPSALAAGPALVLLASGQGVLWWDPATGARGRARSTGTDALALATDGRGIFAVFTQPATLSRSLERLDADGDRTVLDADYRGGLLVESGGAYWGGLGGIHRDATDGSSTPEVVVRRSANGLAVYGDRLYWGQSSVPASGTPRNYLLTGKRQSAPVGAPPGSRTAVWERTVGGPGDEIPWRVAVDATGDVRVLGSAVPGTDLGGGDLGIAPPGAPAVAALAADGTYRWSATLEGGEPPDLRAGACLAVNGAGASVVGAVAADGSTRPLARGFDHQGAVTFTHVGPERRVYRACAVTELGDVLLAEDADTTWPDAVATAALHLVRLGPDGMPAGEIRLGTLDDGETFATHHVVVSPLDDALVVAGALSGRVDLGDGARDSQGEAAVLVTKVAPGGALRWSRLLRGAETAHVGIDAGGRVVVTGVTTLFVDFGAGPVWVSRALEPFAYVARFDATGTLEGSALLDADAQAFAVLDDGSVVLAGWGAAHFAGPAPVSIPAVGSLWLAHVDASFSVAAAWTRESTQYGAALAVGGGRLVVAGGAARAGESGVSDVQWDLSAYALP